MEFQDEKAHEKELYAGPASEQDPTGTPGNATGRKGKNNRWGFSVKILYNKYFLSVLFFLIWILFFDSNNLISRYRVKSELHQMYRQKGYYLQEISVNEKIRDQLMHDLDEAETFGREKYLMKRDKEDIYLIIEEEGPAQ